MQLGAFFSPRFLVVVAYLSLVLVEGGHVKVVLDGAEKHGLAKSSWPENAHADERAILAILQTVQELRAVCVKAVQLANHVEVLLAIPLWEENSRKMDKNK